MSMNVGILAALCAVEAPCMQVLERIAEEIDPEGTGLSFDDFLSIVSRMPDFITNFRMAV